jgi:hypothetical protein
MILETHDQEIIWLFQTSYYFATRNEMNHLYQTIHHYQNGSYELEGGKSMMKSMEIKTIVMQELVLVKRVHEGDDEGSLFEH